MEQVKTVVDKREQIANILKENITFSPQIDAYVIHGAIDKILELFSTPKPEAVVSLQEVKTVDDLINSIEVNVANFKYIAITGKINGSLYIDIKRVMDLHASQFKEENERLKSVLNKINDIRNSIIGYHSINWSAHIYPLVAALHEAGIEGMGYDEAKAMAKDQLQRIKEGQEENTRLREALESVIALRMLIEYPKNVHPTHETEARAINAMLNKVEQALQPSKVK